MSNDFVRSLDLGGPARHIQRRSWLQQLHVDLPLLALVCVLSLVGICGGSLPSLSICLALRC